MTMTMIGIIGMMTITEEEDDERDEQEQETDVKRIKNHLASGFSPAVSPIILGALHQVHLPTRSPAPKL